MTSFRKLYRKSSVQRSALAAVMMGVSGSALATGSAAAAQEPEGDDDVIVVQGVRGSLQDSIATKRDSDEIIDVLSATDFLDFPDLNAGDALVRLPGVTGGSGLDSPNSLSIRGFDSAFGLTTLNGRLLTSDRAGRNVRTNLFPSALLSQVAVLKTPSASTIEGGLSGTVELRTGDPLDALSRSDQDQLIRVRLRTVDDPGTDGVSGFDDPEIRFDGSYRRAFLDGKLGLGVGLTYNDTYRVDYELGGKRPELDGAVVEDGFDPITTPSGQIIFDDDGDSSTPDPFSNNDALISPANIDNEIEGRDEQRTSGAIVLTYKPDEAWTVQSDILFARDEGRFDRAQIELDSFGDGISGTVDRFGYIDDVLFDDVRTSYLPREREEEIDTLTAGLNVGWMGQAWSLSGDIFYSEVTLDRYTVETRLRPEDDDLFVRIKSGLERDTLGFEYVDPFDPDNPEELRLNRIRVGQVDRADESLAFRLDARRVVDYGNIDSIEFGLRFEDRQKEVSTDDDRYDRWDDDDVTPADLAAVQSDFIAEDGFIQFGGDAPFAQSWYHASAFDIFEQYGQLAGRIRLDEDDDLFQTASVDEQTIAGYLQANLGGEFLGFPIRGNFGVRVVETEVETNGFSGSFNVVQDGDEIDIVTDNTPTAVAESNSYTNVLPSLNLIFALQDDVDLRIGAAKTIARPSFEFIFPVQSFGTENLETSDDVTEQTPERITRSGGNPAIEPYEANNFDISLEWSPNRDTLIAISGFYKELETIITPGISVEGTVDTDFGALPLRSITFVNEEPFDKDVYGLEFQAQTTFTFLPQPLDELGVQFNYSLIDSEITEVINDESLYTAFNADGTIAEYVEADAGVRQPLADISEELTNLTVFWEGGPISTRVSARWESESYENQPVGSNSITAEGRRRLDANINYDITDRWRFQIQGRNLTDEYLHRYYQPVSPIDDPRAAAQLDNPSVQNRLRDLRLGARQIYFGISYRN